jgi:hypothetical protein
MSSSPAPAPSPDWQRAAANTNEAASAERCAALEAELAAVEPLVGAAILVTTAFRMRDEAGLIATLRLLTAAVRAVEERRARDGA